MKSEKSEKRVWVLPWILPQRQIQIRLPDMLLFVCVHFLHLALSATLISGGTSFSPWEGLCKLSIKSQQPLLYNNYLSNGSSISGVLPSPGQCLGYKLPTITYPTSPCSSGNGTLTLELWLTDSNENPIDPRRYMPGIHLVAARSSSTPSGYPSVKEIYDGSAVYQPAYKPSSSDYALQYSQLDASSITRARTSQRVVIPIGMSFDYSTATTDNWSITIANMNEQPSWDSSSVLFSIRATCLATPPPCPRSGPNGPTCSANGACTTLNTCACNPGFGGSSCSYPYTDMTSSQGALTPFQVPGQSWRFFSVTAPDSQAPNDLSAVAANILSELMIPANSQAAYQTVLVMSPRGPDANTSLYDPPSLMDPYPYTQPQIDYLYFNFADECTGDPPCILPYQSRNYRYSLQRLKPWDLKSWWIGVYNNAPATSNISSTNLTLRARWQVSNSLSSASSLCPLDCSGQGSCTSPQIYASDSMQPLFQCNCNQRYGGPFCQGLITTPTISDGYPLYDSAVATLQPGAWQFYSVQGLNGGSSNQPNFFIEFSSNASPSGQTPFLTFAPYVTNSVGNLYFRSDLSYVITKSSSYTIPTNRNRNNWVFGVYNSNISSTSTLTFRLKVYYPTATVAPATGPTMLQLIVIGGVSGFVLLLLIFMVIKLLLMRRYIYQRQEIILVQQQMQARHERRAGVPQEIIASFPTFEFDPEEFKAEMVQRAEAKKTPNPNPNPNQQAAPPTKALELKSSTGQSSPGRSSATDLSHTRPAVVASEGGCDIETGGGLTSEGESGSKTEASRSDGDDKEDVLSDAEAEEPVRNDDNGFELPQCSICIGDFEQGEALRRLPCNHIFHRPCIDQWMATHTTCPNCRRGLCPRPNSRQTRRARQTRAAVNQVQPAGVTVAELLAAADQQQQQQQAGAPTATRTDERIMAVIRSLRSILNRPSSRPGDGEGVELQVVPAPAAAPSPSPLAALPPAAPSPTANRARGAVSSGAGPTTQGPRFSQIDRPDRIEPLLSDNVDEDNQVHAVPVTTIESSSRAIAESVTPRSLTPIRGSTPLSQQDSIAHPTEWSLPGSPDTTPESSGSRP